MLKYETYPVGSFCFGTDCEGRNHGGFQTDNRNTPGNGVIKTFSPLSEMQAVFPIKADRISIELTEAPTQMGQATIKPGELLSLSGRGLRLPFDYTGYSSGINGLLRSKWIFGRSKWIKNALYASLDAINAFKTQQMRRLTQQMRLKRSKWIFYKDLMPLVRQTTHLMRQTSHIRHQSTLNLATKTHLLRQLTHLLRHLTHLKRFYRDLKKNKWLWLNLSGPKYLTSPP